MQLLAEMVQELLAVVGAAAALQIHTIQDPLTGYLITDCSNHFENVSPLSLLSV